MYVLVLGPEVETLWSDLLSCQDWYGFHETRYFGNSDYLLSVVADVSVLSIYCNIDYRLLCVAAITYSAGPQKTCTVSSFTSSRKQ